MAEQSMAEQRVKDQLTSVNDHLESIERKLDFNLGVHRVQHVENEKEPSMNLLYLWFLVPVFLLLFVGICGPWYHDCNNKDCSTQRDYGIYCDDYCIYGNYGVGASTFLFVIVLIGVMCYWLIK